MSSRKEGPVHAVKTIAATTYDSTCLAVVVIGRTFIFDMIALNLTLHVPTPTVASLRFPMLDRLLKHDLVHKISSKITAFQLYTAG